MRRTTLAAGARLAVAGIITLVALLLPSRPTWAQG